MGSEGAHVPQRGALQLTISIIIPAYNSERHLTATIESVLAQTRTDWELLIIDDGSTDGTSSIAERYAARDGRVRALRQANAGGAAARNRGTAEVTPGAEYVAFLDHDDIYEPDAMQILTGVLEAHPEAVAAHGLARYIDGSGRAIRAGEAETWCRSRVGIVGKRVVAWPLDAPTTLDVLLTGIRILTPGQGLIRRAALDQVGPADEALYSADWDHWLRLAVRGDIGFVDRVVINYRRHEGNMSRQHKAMTDSISHIRRKLLASPELNEEQRRVATAACLYAQRFNAGLRLAWAQDDLARGRVHGAAKQLRHAVLYYHRYMSRQPV